MFDAHGTITDRDTEVSSKDMMDYLVTLKERPWAEFGRTGKPVTANRVARLLKPFKIIPGPTGGHDKERGYRLARFLDAFARHLPEKPL